MDKYEKLYNEALERFKSFKEKYYTKDTNLGDVIFDKNGEMQKGFNGIFPELADTEDERIRKEIISIVKEYGRICEKEGDPCCTIGDCLAYLEKQKEYVSEKFDDVWALESCEELIAEGKKLSPRFKELLKDVCHAWYDKGIELGKKQKEPHYTKRNALFDKCVAECDPEIMQRVSDEIDEMLGKEQSTDEGFDSLFDDYCDAHPDGLTLEECGKFFFSKGKLAATNDFSLALAEKYCQGLRDGQEEYWNPTEEDVTLFNKAITTNKALTPDERAKLDIIRMKFKHRPVIKQKGQKPAERFAEAREKYKVEWSEEDEKMRNLAIEWAETMSGQFRFVDMDSTDFRKIIAWLKSLRPSWKPSEQEKGALRTAIHILTDERSFPKAAAQLQNILDAFEGEKSRKDWKPSEEQMEALNALNCHGDLSYVGQQNQLISLYNDLKRLKGGVAPMKEIDE